MTVLLDANRSQDQSSSSTSSSTPVGTEATTTASQTSLTSFNDQAPQLTVTTIENIPRTICSPFGEKSSDLLTREYLLDTFNWGITDVAKTYAFPDFVIANSTAWAIIPQILSMYRYYRADVEIRIKMETTPYHQGSLMVGYMPGVNYQLSAAVPTKYRLSGMNSQVLCASLQNELVFTIPFTSPRDWIDILETWSTGMDSSIGRMWIVTLNTLIPTQANMPTSVPVLVYWRFKNIKQTMPISGPTVAPLEAKGHMSKHITNTEAHTKAKQGVDTTGIVSTVSAMLKEAPVIGGIYSSAVGVLKSIAPDLSKPISQEAGMMILSPYMGQAATTTGLDVAQELGTYPNAQVSSSPMFYGMETSHMPVADLAKKPMLYDSVALTNPSPIWFTGVTPVAHQAQRSDWLYNIMRAFRYWRGSIKYLLHFCVPSFYAARVQISLAHQNGNAVAQIGDIISKIVDIKGDTVVSLNIPYMQSVKWLDPRQNTNVPILQVTVLTTIVGSSAPATPTIYLNVWRAGGEDTEFAGLMAARDGVFVPSEAVGHMDINTLFKAPFDPIIPGTTMSMENHFVMADIAGTVSDCLKRRSAHIPDANGNATIPGVFLPGTSNVNFTTIGREPFHYFSNMFLFWRGSRTLKHWQNSDLIKLAGMQNNSSIGDGAGYMFITTGTNANLCHLESVNVPYYNPTPFNTTWTGSQNVTVSYSASVEVPVIHPVDIVPDVITNTTTRLSIEAGDDFMLLYPVPFFPLELYPSVDEDIPTTSTVSKNKTKVPPVTQDRVVMPDTNRRSSKQH